MAILITRELESSNLMPKDTGTDDYVHNIKPTPNLVKSLHGCFQANGWNISFYIFFIFFFWGLYTRLTLQLGQLFHYYTYPKS